VLHRYDWSETSLILDLFTREGGRLTAAAKGAKRPTSNLRSVLLPFVPVQVQLSRRKESDDDAAIVTLRHAEWAGAQGLLQGSGLFLGFYLNELLMKLLPRGDAQEQVFDAYASTLRYLITTTPQAATSKATASDAGHASPAEDSDRAQAALRAFELMLLRDMGWLPDLSVATLTQAPVKADRPYVLRAEVGLLVADRATDGVPGAQWLRLQAALTDRDDDALRHTCESFAVPLRSMLRGMLAPHLPASGLKTRDVALGVQKLRQRA
jgi:DNA repair protein RecO (recombination protein O)